MTLEEKIRTIDKPSLASTIGLLPSDAKETVEEFFNDFVVPRFPSPDIIKQWHRVLMDYTKDLSNISCCVRYGNNGSKKVSDAGESEYYKLRRGWLTKNIDDEFEYFFADNFFSAFIYKMALDGFAPVDTNELRSVFQQHKFPYGFGYKIDKKINEYKGVVIGIGKQPGFLDNYKLSHVFDAGECFIMSDGSVLGDAELSPQYYPIGHSDDFLKNPDKIRRMQISPEAKKVIVAKFLRFAHPMNYFLTPGKKLHQCKTKVYMNDIGEDPIMIHYVKKYLAKEFPTEYAEFIDQIMWKDGYIGIEYARPVKSTKKKASASISSVSTGGVSTTVKGGKAKTSASPTTPSGGVSGSFGTTKRGAGRRRYTDDDKYKEAACYLRKGVSLPEVERICLGVNNSGSTAKGHLNKLGIDTSDNSPHKGMLSVISIDDAITNATDATLKNTLEEIKVRGL